LPDTPVLGATENNAAGLSSSAIAAIVCSIVTGLAVLLAIILIVRRRRKKAPYLPPNIMYVEIDDASQTAVAELAPDSLPGPGAALWRKKSSQSARLKHPGIPELPPNPPRNRLLEPVTHAAHPTSGFPSSSTTASGTLAMAPERTAEDAQSATAGDNGEEGGSRDPPSTGDEFESLQERRVHLAERKWRLMELDRIEDEEAEIERRLTQLKSSI